MIENIYIIDERSGDPFIALDLIKTKKKIEPDLFYGLIKSFGYFTQEAYNEDLHEIILDSSRVIYEGIMIDGRNFILVSIDNLKNNKIQIQNLMRKIAKAFMNIYNDKISNSSGVNNMFQPLSERIREIIMIDLIDKNSTPIKRFVSNLSETISREKECFENLKKKIDSHMWTTLLNVTQKQ